jgi:hypothetical protein
VRPKNVTLPIVLLQIQSQCVITTNLTDSQNAIEKRRGGTRHFEVLTRLPTLYVFPISMGDHHLSRHGEYPWLFIWVIIPFAALQKNGLRATNNRIFLHCSLGEEVGSPTHILRVTSLG